MNDYFYIYRRLWCSHVTKTPTLSYQDHEGNQLKTKTFADSMQLTSNFLRWLAIIAIFSHLMKVDIPAACYQPRQPPHLSLYYQLQYKKHLHL